MRHRGERSGAGVERRRRALDEALVPPRRRRGGTSPAARDPRRPARRRPPVRRGPRRQVPPARACQRGSVGVMGRAPRRRGPEAEPGRRRSGGGWESGADPMLDGAGLAPAAGLLALGAVRRGAWGPGDGCVGEQLLRPRRRRRSRRGGGRGGGRLFMPGLRGRQYASRSARRRSTGTRCHGGARPSPPVGALAGLHRRRRCRAPSSAQRTRRAARGPGRPARGGAPAPALAVTTRPTIKEDGKEGGAGADEGEKAEKTSASQRGAPDGAERPRRGPRHTAVTGVVPAASTPASSTWRAPACRLLRPVRDGAPGRGLIRAGNAAFAGPAGQQREDQKEEDASRHGPPPSSWVSSPTASGPASSIWSVPASSAVPGRARTSPGST